MKIREFEIEPLCMVKDILDPEWSWISDNNHWNGFHLWYMFRNQVHIETKQEVYDLTEGDTFLFDLSQNHYCTHHPENPAAMFTVYFQCKQSEILQQLLCTQAIPKKNHPSMFAANMQLFENAVRSCNSKEEIEMWLAPIFYQLLTPWQNDTQHSKISQICHMIDETPHKSYTLDQLACQAGYSQNQFIRLFRQETGMTPYAYCLQARIMRARHLLLFSNYSITQIAQLLGFHDLNHFSSQFKRKTGYCPKEFVAIYTGSIKSNHSKYEH